MNTVLTDQVSKVTVSETTQNITVSDGTGPVGPTGPSGAPGYYGSFYSTVTQTNPSGTATNLMTFDTTESASGVAIAANSQITVTNAGIYNVAFSAQIDKTDSGNDDIEIFLVKNGTPVTYSNTQLTVVGNAGKVVAAWNWVVQLAAADYVEIGWFSADTSLRILAQAAKTSPTRPAVPSVIATINQIKTA